MESYRHSYSTAKDMVVINLFITHFLTILTYVKIVEQRHSPHPHILKEQMVYPET